MKYGSTVVMLSAGQKLPELRKTMNDTCEALRVLDMEAQL